MLPDSQAGIDEEVIESDSFKDASDEVFRQESLVASPIKVQNDVYRIFNHEDNKIHLNPDLFYEAEYTHILESLVQTIVDIEAPIRIDVLAR